MVSKIFKLEDLIRKRSQTDLSQYRGRDMIQIYRRLWQWILFYRASYMEVFEREEQLSNMHIDLKDIQDEFEGGYGKLGTRIHKELAIVKAIAMQKLSNVKKIQKIYRGQKTIEWENILGKPTSP